MHQPHLPRPHIPHLLHSGGDGTPPTLVPCTHRSSISTSMLCPFCLCVRRCALPVAGCMLLLGALSLRAPALREFRRAGRPCRLARASRAGGGRISRRRGGCSVSAPTGLRAAATGGFDGWFKAGSRPTLRTGKVSLFCGVPVLRAGRARRSGRRATLTRSPPHGEICAGCGIDHRQEGAFS